MADLVEKRYKELLEREVGLPPQPSDAAPAAEADDSAADQSRSQAKLLLANLRSSQTLLLSADRATQQYAASDSQAGSSDQFALSVIKTAAERKKELEAARPAESTTQNGVENDNDILSISTRLNGKHTWKWKFKQNDPFSKVFAEIMI
jgi:hypothetical protein